MDEKIEKYMRQIEESGYKNYDDTCKEFNETVAKYKLVQPDASEESIQAHVLNGMLAKLPKTTDLKGYFLGVAGEFDQNKKIREKALAEGYVNEQGEAIYHDLPKAREKFNDTPIPSPEKSSVRVCYFFGTEAKEGQEENWKPAVLWNRTGLVPELMKATEFKSSGDYSKTAPSIGTLDGTKFNVTSQEPINFVEMVSTALPNNICAFDGITDFEQPKEFPVMIFKAQVVRATVTQSETMSNPVELRMTADNLEDIIKAENVDNVTLWCDKAVPLDFGEGDIVWCVANKYVKSDSSLALKGFGFFVETSIFPQSKPLPINSENTKATITQAPIIPQIPAITMIEEEIQQQAFEEDLKQANPLNGLEIVGGDEGGAEASVESTTTTTAE